MLLKIAHRLNEAGVEWALGASMMLYFKDITSDFHDIDLMVVDRDAEWRQKCLSPAKKYKLYKSSINKSIHFVQRSLSSSTRVQRVTAQLNLSRE